MMLDGAPITSIDAHREVDHIGVQELLTVREIMTPRDRFIACLAGETVFDAFADVPEIYDAVPVLAGNDKADVSAEVVGLLRRADVPTQRWLDPVDDHLDEHPVEAPIAPDLPILKFVERIEGEAHRWRRDRCARKRAERRRERLGQPAWPLFAAGTQRPTRTKTKDCFANPVRGPYPR
jgi:hypothetical protein